MDLKKRMEDAVCACGFFEWGYVDPRNLQFHEEVRHICEGNACGGYGASWACPPATGSLEECRTRTLAYGKMLLFTRKYDLEDSFDYEGMVAGKEDFGEAVHAFHKSIADVDAPYLLLGNEGCHRCQACTYPDAPCRFPDQLHHSLESYGFIVKDLADEAGIRYHNGPDTVTYFGAVLFGTPE